MAIFKGKKETEVVKPSPEIRKEMGDVGRGPSSTFSTVIIRPRITEKATDLSEKGVYTFDVLKNATKSDVAKAVETLFKVIPEKVTVVPVRSKILMARNKKGRTRSGKKAYVHLKEGDKIEFV